MEPNPYEAPAETSRTKIAAKRSILGWVGSVVCGGLIVGSIAPAVGIEGSWKIDSGDFALGGLIGMAVYWWATRRRARSGINKVS